MIEKRNEKKARANGHSPEPLGEVTPPRNLNRRGTDKVRKADEQSGGLLIAIVSVIGFLGLLITLLITLQ